MIDMIIQARFISSFRKVSEIFETDRCVDVSLCQIWSIYHNFEIEYCSDNIIQLGYNTGEESMKPF